MRTGYKRRRLWVLAELALKMAGAALKSVNEVLREYRDALTRLVVDAANGNVTAGEMSRAHKALLKRLAPESYQEGMREGGISDPAGDMDDDDRATVSDWVSEQSGFTLEFARAAFAASKLSGDEKTAARSLVLDRVDLWVRALDALGGLGRLSAQENIPATFKLGPTEEHCPTCSKLNRQRKRLRTWKKNGLLPQQPGNDNFACHGYECLCTLHADDGRQVYP